MTTEKPRGIHAKLAEAMRLCSYVQKKGYNKAQNYWFARHVDVVEKVNEALSTLGISVQTAVEIVDKWTMETKSGPWVVVTVRLTLTLTDAETKETAVFQGLGSGADGGDKAIPKAQTGASKYAYELAFAMGTGDDAEGDESTDKQQGTQEKAAGKTLEEAVEQHGGRPADRMVKHPETGAEISLLALKLDMGGGLANAKSETEVKAWYARYAETIHEPSKGAGNDLFTGEEIEEIRHEYGRALKRVKPKAA